MLPNVDVGPVASKQQQMSIAKYLEIGKSESTLVIGGSLLQDGVYEKGFYVQPTLFADAPLDSRLMTEEIFGPVLGISPVANLDKAIHATNATPYGLSASLISRDMGEIMRFTNEVQVGMIHINDETAGAEPHTSFGGYKQSSSFSREQGKSARDFFTQIKTIYMDYTHGDD